MRFSIFFSTLALSATASLALAQSPPAPVAPPVAPVKCELKDYTYTSKSWLIEINDAKVLGGKPASFTLTYQAERGVDGDGRDVPKTNATAKLVEAYSTPRENMYIFDTFAFSLNPETGEATVFTPWHDNYSLLCSPQK